MAILAVALVALPNGTALVAPPTVGRASSAALAIDPALAPVWTRVNYSSSVDRFPLGYWVTLPLGFNSRQSYPVSVYLHGLMGLINTSQRGGYTSDIVGSNWGNNVARAASMAGFILVAPSTRMVDGFYVNSKYTGPQEQDILDAIQSVRSHYHVSGVYLFGQSMGSIGTYSIVLHHASLFAGLGIINDCGDVYAAAYWRILQNLGSKNVITLITGGTFPNQSAYAQGLFYYLSASRYYPENLSGLRLYEANGGADVLCPTSSKIWAQYQQGNDTILTSTCATIAAFRQPANCTDTLKSLWQGNTSFHWRYDYVALGGHSPAILNAPDLYAYWKGLKSGGVVCGGAGAPPTACP